MVSVGTQSGNMKPIQSKELAEVFQASRDNIPTKPYYMDGDAELYTEDNMLKRDQLKDSPAIQKAIAKFIEDHNMLYGRKQVCMVEQYVRVFTKVGCVLRPEIDVDELSKMLRDEFENDLQPRNRFIAR